MTTSATIGHSAIVITFLFGDCVVDMLSVGEVIEAHIVFCEYNYRESRLDAQPTPPLQHVDKVLNDTRLMLKHPPWLDDGNKWCDNKVETRDVHCALIQLHGSQ